MVPPKRDRVVEQTRKEFLEVGYSGFTMDDIASKTGISKATIYKYFPTKHQLIQELVQEILAEAHRAKQEILNSGKSFILCMAEILKLVRENKNFLQGHILRDLEKNAPDILRLIHEEMDMRSFEIMEVLLTRGQDEKKVRPDVRPELVAYAFFTLFHEFIRGEVMDRFHLDLDEIHGFLMRLTLGGVLTRSGETELAKIMHS